MKIKLNSIIEWCISILIVIVFLYGMFFSAPANAEEFLKNRIDLICCTYHFDRTTDYTEINLGGRYSRYLTEGVALDIGYYNNSEGGKSAILGMSREIKVSKNVRLSIGAGFVSGYERGTIPYILPMISYKERVNLILIPLPGEYGGGVNLSFTLVKF